MNFTNRNKVLIGIISTMQSTTAKTMYPDKGAMLLVSCLKSIINQVNISLTVRTEFYQ